MTPSEQSSPPPPAEGQMVATEHEGSAVAVAMLDGTLHAFDDTCPHAGCSLADGELDGQNVVCPCHMATFDVTTGAVVAGPAPSPVATWSVRDHDGALVLGERQDAAPGTHSSGDAAPAPAARPDTDVTVLVEREHEALRRQFADLDTLTDVQELTTAWTALRELLEIHASAEESLLYPMLARSADEGAEEAEHAVRDHNGIRDSVRAVEEHSVGDDGWWAAVRNAREVNEDHLGEEERDPLPLFRRNVTRTRRDEIGRQWLDFAAEHRSARGLTGEDADPDAVVEGRA